MRPPTTSANALYENLSNQHPKPFAWKYTRDKLTALFTRIAAHERLLGEFTPPHQSNVA